MSKNDKALRRYYRQVRGWLPCGGRLRKQIMEQLRENVEDYLDHHPEADFQQFLEHFGDPKTIAGSYVDAQNTEEILTALRIRRRVVGIVAVVAVLVLLVWIVGVVSATRGYGESASAFLEIA